MGYISFSNSKLGKFIGNFNIPSASQFPGDTGRIFCPFATDYCMSACYAKRGNFMFQKIRNALYRNYEFTLTQQFVPHMVSELQYHAICGVSKIRLHSSGEFYSTPYFRKWCEIARNVPGITFLAFTRNTRIPVNELPGNFRVLFSTDESTVRYHPMISRRTYIVPKGAIPPRGYVQCGGSCATCSGKCFSRKNNNVYFNKH
jgi:hypothetical protein